MKGIKIWILLSPSVILFLRSSTRATIEEEEETSYQPKVGRYACEQILILESHAYR